MKPLAIATALALLAMPVAAHAESIKLGILDCSVEGGAGILLKSHKEAICNFKPTKGLKETYYGTVNKYGLDVGVTGPTVMSWLVLAATPHARKPGALAGTYVGAGADASVAVGGGAHILVGGSGKSFSLQPLGVQAQTGVNLAIGIEDFTLRAAK